MISSIYLRNLCPEQLKGQMFQAQRMTFRSNNSTWFNHTMVHLLKYSLTQNCEHTRSLSFSSWKKIFNSKTLYFANNSLKQELSKISKSCYIRDHKSLYDRRLFNLTLFVPTFTCTYFF